MQKNIVNNSYEYPILENIDPHPLIKNFGTDFKEDRISVADYGELNPEAIKLMDRVGWQ